MSPETVVTDCNKTLGINLKYTQCKPNHSSAKSAAMAKPRPSTLSSAIFSVIMPTKLPSLSNNPPPENDGKKHTALLKSKRIRERLTYRAYRNRARVGMLSIAYNLKRAANIDRQCRLMVPVG